RAQRQKRREEWKAVFGPSLLSILLFSACLSSVPLWFVRLHLFDTIGRRCIRRVASLRRSLEEAPLQRLIERRPGRRLVAVFPDIAREGVHLGVEVVERVERDRLRRHGQLWAAELVGAVMAQDHMLEP